MCTKIDIYVFIKLVIATPCLNHFAFVFPVQQDLDICLLPLVHLSTQDSIQLTILTGNNKTKIDIKFNAYDAFLE